MATKSSNATAAKKGPTKAELEAQIAELQALLQAQTTAAQATPSVTTAPAVTFTVPNTDVTIVYCSDSMGYAQISNMELHFNKFGEEFTLSRNQFDELVGKYRRWFDSGILAVSYKNLDLAAAKGVRTDKEIGFDATILNSIGSMSLAQLEDLWNRTTVLAHRESIVSYYKRKMIEQDPLYLDRAKVDLLNRLTNGGFKREQDELSGRYKITPTEM